MHVCRATRAVCRVVCNPTATPITSSQRAALTKAAVSSLQQYVALPISVGGSRRRPLSFVALDGDSEGEATTTATSLDEKTAENQDAKETEPKARPVRRRIPRERPPPITLELRPRGQKYQVLCIMEMIWDDPGCCFVTSDHTDRAAAHLMQLLASKPDKVGVRLGVKRRGCNGLSYTMKYADEKPKGDEEVVLQAPSVPGVRGLQFEAGTGRADVAQELTGGRAEAGASGVCNGGDIVGQARLFVDPMATLYIAGTVMDWEETELSSEFTFHNPNAKGECGCGESFNV